MSHGRMSALAAVLALGAMAAAGPVESVYRYEPVPDPKSTTKRRQRAAPRGDDSYRDINTKPREPSPYDAERLRLAAEKRARKALRLQAASPAGETVTGPGKTQGQPS